MSELREYVVDLHVHVGRARGKQVKMAASKDLTVRSILEACSTFKGVDMVGIIDSASPLVLSELWEMMDEGLLREDPEGGLKFKPPDPLNTRYGPLPSREITLILGEEVEVLWRGRPFHVLIYVPFVRDAEELSRELSKYTKNLRLSSQRTELTIGELVELALSLGGTLIPAHAFTPHKGVYGSATHSLEEMFGELWKEIPAIELGLSADTYLADFIPELRDKTFLSNSDAHSVPKIAREHNLLILEKPTYKELMMALRRRDGRRVKLNVGLDPRLGKYHRSYCNDCKQVIDSPPPVLRCPRDPTHRIVKGVLDRIVEISGRTEPEHPPHRPPYLHQVPLEFIPGLGESAYYKLIRRFHNEMRVIHFADISEIEETVGKRIATYIKLMREGKLELEAGGGGIYGRVKRESVTSQLRLF